MENVTERTEKSLNAPLVAQADANAPLENVVQLNHQAALASFTEEERKEVLALADSIDVMKVENVMNYGSVALKRTFDQCEKFLKEEKGSHADQEVISQVVELSKKASDSYDDFNLVLQEPGFFQKMFLKLFNSGNNSRTEKIQHSAVTCYKLLSELKKSYDAWLVMLKNAMGDIELSLESDYDSIGLLEKYIIAGKIAEDRITGELQDIQKQYQETGLQKYSYSYELLKEGYDIFYNKMAQLERSRAAYYLSLGQLKLIKRSNRNAQISIHTQADNSTALIAQQLRNAILNEKTREVVEGQKAIARLNDELIKDISHSVGLTAEETEKLIYTSFYNMEAAKEAYTFIINSCDEIKKITDEMRNAGQGDMDQIDSLIKELEPYVKSIEAPESAGTSSSTGTSTSVSTELKF